MAVEATDEELLQGLRELMAEDERELGPIPEEARAVVEATDELTTLEVTQELGMKRTAVLRWLKLGAFEDAYRLPNNEWRIPRATVDKMKEELGHYAADTGV